MANTSNNSNKSTVVSATAQASVFETLMDANSASKEDFAKVVGETHAQLLINYRSKITRLSYIEEFHKIKGLSYQSAMRLKENFYVTPALPEKLTDKNHSCVYTKLEDFHTLVAEKPFFFLHANVSNLRKNLYALVKCIHPLAYLPDVICVTETKNPEREIDVTLLSYDFYSTSCTCLFKLIRGVGGAAIYVKKARSFNQEQRKDLEFGNADAENTWVEVSKPGPGPNIVVGAIYRHQHTANLNTFLNCLRQAIQKIKQENKLFYIFCGANIDLGNKKENKPILEMLEQEECLLLVDKPTFIKRSRREVKSVIVDHVYTNDKVSNKRDVGILQLDETSRSLHFPVYCFV